MSARPEITGRKISDACGNEQDAFTITEFCRRHRISQAFYFKLKRLGLGPREMNVLTRVLISKESAADWRREHTLFTPREEGARTPDAALADAIRDAEAVLHRLRSLTEQHREHEEIAAD
jgi:hypothetical protein